MATSSKLPLTDLNSFLTRLIGQEWAKRRPGESCGESCHALCQTTLWPLRVTGRTSTKMHKIDWGWVVWSFEMMTEIPTALDLAGSQRTCSRPWLPQLGQETWWTNWCASWHHFGTLFLQTEDMFHHFSVRNRFSWEMGCLKSGLTDSWV